MDLRQVASIPLVLPFDFAPGDDAFVPDGVTTGHGGVWSVTARGAIARVDPTSGKVAAFVRLPGDATGSVRGASDAIWVATGLLGVYRIDARTNRVAARIAFGSRDHRLAVNQVVMGGGAVFAIGSWTDGGVLQPGNGLARIAAAGRGTVRLAALPAGPLVATFGGGALWIARPRASVVDRLDPRSGRVFARMRVPTTGPLAFSGGKLWIATAGRVVSSR